MTLTRLFAMLAIVGCLQPALAAEPTKPEDISVTGKKITQQDLADSNPVLTLSKDEILPFMTTGKPACKRGSVTAAFEAPSTFVFSDERIPLDKISERVKTLKDAGKISCFHVAARAYDKAVYERLSHDLVDTLGVSLFWDEPAAKP